MPGSAQQGLPAFDPVAERAAFQQRRVAQQRGTANEGDVQAANNNRAFLDAERRAKAAERQLDPQSRERAELQRQRIKQGVGAPVQLPPPALSTPEEDAGSMAQREQQMNDQVGAGMQRQYGAMARQRANLARRAQRSAASEDMGLTMAERGAQGLYSLIFQTGATAGESAPADGGFTATASVGVNMWKALLTIFSGFNDKIRSTFLGRWIPQKFDLDDEDGLGHLYQFEQYLDFIWACVVMALYFFALNFAVFVGVIIMFAVTSPVEFLKMFF